MNHFTQIEDVPDPVKLVEKARICKLSPEDYRDAAYGKSIILIFLSPSLRTRISTQKAASILGMDVHVFNLDQEGWKLEFEDSVVMDGDAPEHVREAAAVLGTYADIIGIRSFPKFSSREEDYAEAVINQFRTHAGVPIVSLESAVSHPLQALTDMLTIEELKKTAAPRVVLSWVPHIKPLPQAVPNSFVQWSKALAYDLVVTHPEGYELAPDVVGDVTIVHDQDEALRGADFVYAKNWSSYTEYGKMLSSHQSWMLSNEKMKLTNQARFMHCLPVRRNLVVKDEVLDGPDSVVIQQAGNRLPAALAVLDSLLKS